MSNRILLAGLATMLPFAAGANDLDYTYVHGGYVSSTTDAGPADIDGDGFGIRGSFAVNDTFHVFADYVSQDLDFAGLDTTTYDIGAGAHWGIRPNMHVVSELSWVKAKVDTPFGSASEDGYGVGAGLRFRPANRVELQGMINYVDLDGSDTSLSLGGRYYLSDIISVGGSLGFSDDVTLWSLGLRADFGRR